MGISTGPQQPDPAVFRCEGRCCLGKVLQAGAGPGERLKKESVLVEYLGGGSLNNKAMMVR